MGTSTVSGPFRSANGFQELVDGQWVPVGGGVGQSTIQAEAGGVVTLNFVTPGQLITVIGPMGSINPFTVTVAPVAGVDFWLVDGLVIEPTFPPTIVNYASQFPITLSSNTAAGTILQFAFVGIGEPSNYGTPAFVKVFGMGKNA